MCDMHVKEVTSHVMASAAAARISFPETDDKAVEWAKNLCRKLFCEDKRFVMSRIQLRAEISASLSCSKPTLLPMRVLLRPTPPPLLLLLLPLLLLLLLLLLLSPLMARARRQRTVPAISSPNSRAAGALSPERPPFFVQERARLTLHSMSSIAPKRASTMAWCACTASRHVSRATSRNV